MSSQVRVKGSNGTVYVYENTSYWDRDKKKTCHKRKIIGHLDPDTGKVVPNRKKGDAIRSKAPCEQTDSCSVVGYGASAILDHFAEQSGLTITLKAAFPMDWSSILTCAYFLVTEGLPLSHVEQWSADNVTPLGKTLLNERVSELLDRLDRGVQLDFFIKWFEGTSPSAYCAMDITSVSSYSSLNEFVRRGCNRDHESLPQINLLMVTNTKDGTPLYFRALEGPIPDVSTVKETLESFRRIKLRRVHFVMDRGFWSHPAVDQLYSMHNKFLIGIPFSDGIALTAVEENRETIMDHRNYCDVDGNGYYAVSQLQKWGSHRFYVHTYFNSQHAEEINRKFDQRLHQCKRELEQNKPVDAHASDYKEFFLITETPKRGRRIAFNDDAIREYKKNRSGWFVLGTNDIKDPVRALKVYHERNYVEKEFDDLKNERDMKRLRIHSARAMEGRLFIQFIALILENLLREALRPTGWLEQNDLKGALDEIKTLRRVSIPGTRPYLTTPTKTQKMLAEAFGIDVSACV